jgi:acetylornithine deacetylase
VLTAGFAGAVVDLTRQLVAFDSVNPGLVPGAVGEGPIAQFVADRLSGSGFEVRLVPALSDPRRMSVIAVRDGSRPGRTVVLNGHLDTVGVEGMAEPFTARIAGDRMFGRGTSDMKGGVAGLVIAAEQLVAAGAPGRLVLALVADEEDAGLGAETVLGTIGGTSGVRADVCLIAEPTWLDLAVAHRGYAVVRVGLQGRSAHSSQPEQGVDVLAEVRDLVDAVTGGAPGLGSTVELVLARDAWQADDSGSAAELMDLLAAALPAAGAAPPARTGAPYWMESALWQASGVPAVVCGPAGGGLHAVDEWVDLAQLRRYAMAIADAVGRILAG